jgi:hypothetical protein
MSQPATLLRVLLLCGATGLSGQTTTTRILCDFRIDGIQGPVVQVGSKIAPEVQRNVLFAVFTITKYLSAATPYDPKTV